MWAKYILSLFCSFFGHTIRIKTKISSASATFMVFTTHIRYILSQNPTHKQKWTENYENKYSVYKFSLSISLLTFRTINFSFFFFSSHKTHLIARAINSHNFYDGRKRSYSSDFVVVSVYRSEGRGEGNSSGDVMKIEKLLMKTFATMIASKGGWFIIGCFNLPGIISNSTFLDVIKFSKPPSLALTQLLSVC